MIASLPMYDMARIRGANDRLWAAIRKNLGFGPERLSRGGDVWAHWRDPSLVLSQTCGMPFRNALCGDVQLVGTPDYGVCAQAGYYFSVFVVRRGEAVDLASYRARRLAYNETGSQSGWAAPQCHADKMGFRFGNVVQSHGHAKSAAMVADGRADIAALDVVTWHLIKDDPALGGLDIIAQTEPTPGLPFITASKMDAEQIFDATQRAIQEVEPSVRTTLGLKRLVKISSDEYLKVPNPPD